MPSRRSVLKVALLAGLVAGTLQPASAGVAAAEVELSRSAFFVGRTSGSAVAVAFLIRTDLLFGSVPLGNRAFDPGALEADQTFASVPGVVDPNPPRLFGCIAIQKGTSGDVGCEILSPATIEMAPGMTDATMILTVASAVYPGDLTAVLLLKETDDETDGIDGIATPVVSHSFSLSANGVPYQAQAGATGMFVRPARVTNGAVRSSWLHLGGEVTQTTGAILVQSLGDPLSGSQGATAFANVERLLCDRSFEAVVTQLEELEDDAGRDLPWGGNCIHERI